MIKKFMKIVKQKFTYLIDQFKLNKTTNRLEKLPDKVDLQELINSSKDFALSAILDKFLGVERPVIERSHQRNIDRLDLLNYTQGVIEDYCNENALDSSSISLKDVVSHIQAKFNKVKEQQQKPNLEKLVKVDKGDENAQENIEKEKQSNI